MAGSMSAVFDYVGRERHTAQLVHPTGIVPSDSKSPLLNYSFQLTSLLCPPRNLCRAVLGFVASSL